jgi:hypothetical protein
MVKPTPLKQPPSQERLKLSNPNTLMPLEKLILLINSDDHHDHAKHEFIKTALPYCHAPKALEAPKVFVVKHLKTAAQMLAMQRRIMASMCAGECSPTHGRALIESLAIMIRCLDTTALEDRLEQVEANAESGRPVLTIVNAVDDDDTDEAS